MTCEITSQLQAKMWESFVREWVRRVGGDTAVEIFDDQGGVPEEKVAEIGEDLVKACTDSGNIPGMNENCEMDWAAWACFARWYAYLDDEDVRYEVLWRILDGQKDPWKDLAGSILFDDPTVKCDPSASATDMRCCPSNTYTDPYYTGVTAQEEPRSLIERAGPFLLALGGFGFGLFLISAAGEPQPVGR